MALPVVGRDLPWVKGDELEWEDTEGGGCRCWRNWRSWRYRNPIMYQPDTDWAPLADHGAISGSQVATPKHNGHNK